MTIRCLNSMPGSLIGQSFHCVDSRVRPLPRFRHLRGKRSFFEDLVDLCNVFFLFLCPEHRHRDRSFPCPHSACRSANVRGSPLLTWRMRIFCADLPRWLLFLLGIILAYTTQVLRSIIDELCFVPSLLDLSLVILDHIHLFIYTLRP